MKLFLVNLICKSISIPADILADYFFTPLGKWFKNTKLLRIGHYIKFEGQTYLIESVCYHLGLQKALEKRVNLLFKKIFG